MSCDFAVWYPDRHLTDEQAGVVYHLLCEGESDGVAPHPAIDAFDQEITARHPEIDDVPEEQLDNTELCPWSIAFDRAPGHLMMCCVWSKADYVERLVKELACKHGLAVFGPRRERLLTRLLLRLRLIKRGGNSGREQ